MTGNPSSLAAEPDSLLGEVTFTRRRVDHPDAVDLLAEFYAEQVGRYGFAESVDLDPDTYAEPSGVFVVVYRHGEPIGCGSCRWYDRSKLTVEIKKTYLRPSARSMGLGRSLLALLEEQARSWGARRVILETGVRNTAALHLFRRAGYRPTKRYVPGRDPQINRAFVKSLEAHSAVTVPASVTSMR